MALSNWRGKWQGWKNKSNAFRNNCFLGTVPSMQAPKLAVKTQWEPLDSPLTVNSKRQCKTIHLDTPRCCSLVSTSRDSWALTMVNGIDLQPVQLKEPSLDGDVADKMKSLHGPHCADPILLLWQVPWLWPARVRGHGEAASPRERELQTPSLTWHGCCGPWPALGRCQWHSLCSAVNSKREEQLRSDREQTKCFTFPLPPSIYPQDQDRNPQAHPLLF